MYTIGFVGIDNAGKTTIIDIFTKRRLSKTIPTVGVNLEQMSFSEIQQDFSVLDMGGQKNFRLLWVDYLNCVDIILYVIDSSDRERLDEAMYEFQNMLVLTETNPVPILVLVNKIDLPNSITAEEIGRRITSIQELNKRDWGIIETSAITTKGLVDMFYWVYNKLTGSNLNLEVRYKEFANKKYYNPCPLLLELPDGNYCMNHDGFNPIKVVPLEDMFTAGMPTNPEEVIKETIEEFEELDSKVCFNSVFVSDQEDIIYCATDNTRIEVEGITANKEEYIESHNMMRLTGGKMCSECLYKILFSTIRRRLKAGKKIDEMTITGIKEAEYKKEEREDNC